MPKVKQTVYHLMPRLKKSLLFMSMNTWCTSGRRSLHRLFCQRFTGTRASPWAIRLAFSAPGGAYSGICTAPRQRGETTASTRGRPQRSTTITFPTPAAVLRRHHRCTHRRRR
uniref:Secreted protein n=1 Tax=Macrostomum lignano TaxID=282301 RepID=A0A1I8J9B1_9PLAT